MNIKRLTLYIILSSCSMIFATESSNISSIITEGKVSINARIRYENVDESSKDADALTARLRLGYGTKEVNGFGAFVEMEDVRAIIDDYNAAGLNGKANKSVVADVEDTELNRAYLSYKNDYIKSYLGRQRIILDDARFVGNVGWRQNEQTYDAIYADYTGIENWSAKFAYITDVNRIFGPDSGRDFESESTLLNFSYSGLVIGKITAFGYLLDFDNSTGNSCDTFGVRLTGKKPVFEDYSFKYSASFANQKDGGDNATDYSANYYAVDGSIGKNGYSVGVGYEVLGSDDGVVGFKTPLATAHKFNGWADKFLATPADGLEDLYVYAGAKFPFGVSGKLIYHNFEAEHGSGDYGDEIDLVLKKKIAKGLSSTFKFADYSGDSSTSKGDVTKLSIQLDYSY